MSASDGAPAIGGDCANADGGGQKHRGDHKDNDLPNHWASTLDNLVRPERHDLVVGVMPDVGASQPRNPRPRAPVPGDLLFVHPEIRLVRGDVAATAEHDARHPPDRRRCW